GTILVVFFLGWRLGGRWPALLGALGVAIYPPFIHSVGEIMSEPPAMLTLPAAVLAFLWAGNIGPPGEDEPPSRSAAAWLVPGVLFGLTAMFRPEYLFVGAVFVVLAGLRAGRGRGWRPGLSGAAVLLIALLLPILPWTVRNLVVLDKVVPISTGSGKALYVGTYLPGDGEYQRVKAILAERYLGRDLEPGSPELDAVDPTELFDRVAEETHPDLPRDEALGRLGRENLEEYFGEDPLDYTAMTVRKVWRMWSAGVGEAMSSTPGRVVQVLIVLLGLGGFVLLALRRRWWEILALAAPILVITAIGALSLAPPRRNEVLMTLVFPLAGLALSSGLTAIFSGREWSSEQASSQPS
ncbi:MAG TPA: hypothetical protein VFY69_06235, partial [Solirubrobacterales bacterium]|nr:hypothetical protein [Solirubrobacterales bacterium]